MTRENRDALPAQLAALVADSIQILLCTYLSAILLFGLVAGAIGVA